MSSIITAQRLGKLLTWLWYKYIRKSPIKYKELNDYHNNSFFIVIGCSCFAIIIGITLLYFYI